MRPAPWSGVDAEEDHLSSDSRAARHNPGTRLVGQAVWMSGDVVWWPVAAAGSRGRVAVVCVSFNTRELTGLLLWSLRTIVNGRAWTSCSLTTDRGTDRRNAGRSRRAGVCRCWPMMSTGTTARPEPGDILAGRPPGPPPGWIWILDSDVIAARPGVLATAAPPRRPRERPWSVSRSGTNGTRPSASSVFAAPGAALVGGPASGPSPTAATRRSICSVRPPIRAAAWPPSPSPWRAT